MRAAGSAVTAEKAGETEMPIGVKDSTAGLSEGRGSIPRLAIGNEI